TVCLCRSLGAPDTAAPARRLPAAPSASSAPPDRLPRLDRLVCRPQGYGEGIVMRRQQLTEAQITALLDPPTEQRELVRHYTLSAADLAMIRRCRGDHNRLGHALMLCYLRYPGRPLKAGERPPRPLLLFIAEQIDALPESIEDYLAAERNR